MARVAIFSISVGEEGENLYKVTLSQDGGQLFMTLRRKSRILFETAVITPVAPTWTSRPIIVGGATEGVEAAFTSGAYTGTAPVTVSYRYQIDGVDVGSANTPYTPVSGDVGKLLTVTQTATNAVGSAERISAGVVVVADDVDPPIDGDGTALVSANAVTGAVGYRIHHSATDGGALPPTGATVVYVPGAGDLLYTLTGLPPGLRYLWVQSYDGSNYSDPYRIEEVMVL